MHSHPRYWRLPFSTNKGPLSPNIKQKKQSIIIQKMDFLQYAVISLYCICTAMLCILVPVNYLEPPYQIPGMLFICIGLFIVGYLHFQKMFTNFNTHFFKNNDDELFLSVKDIHYDFPSHTIKALQLYPEQFDLNTNDDQELSSIQTTNANQSQPTNQSIATVYHCYALMETKKGELIRIGLFQNLDSTKHATDCLALSNFCHVDIWEACAGCHSSIFNTEQKLENPTVINCFKLNGEPGDCC